MLLFLLFSLTKILTKNLTKHLTKKLTLLRQAASKRFIFDQFSSKIVILAPGCFKKVHFEAALTEICNFGAILPAGQQQNMDFKNMVLYCLVWSKAGPASMFFKCKAEGEVPAQGLTQASPGPDPGQPRV